MAEDLNELILDQMVQFALRRKSKESINSDGISKIIAGVNKLDYSTDSISMLPYLENRKVILQ